MLKFGVINYIFGSPGSGKTTVLAMIAKRYMKDPKFKNKIYANFLLEGATFIPDEAIGYFGFYNSIIFLDECGISYNNREAFSKKGLMQDPRRLLYWKLARHYLEHGMGPKGKIFIASQSWDDVDKKLRDLSTNYYLIKKFGLFRPVTVIKPIYKKVDIDKETHQPTDMYMMDFFWNWKLCLRCLYYKMFNSTEAPKLPEYNAPLLQPAQKGESKYDNYFNRYITVCTNNIFSIYRHYFIS